MKNFKKKELNSRNGITLIALVITIIVLLILAGISIAMLSGDNSILKKGTEARERTGTEQIRERIRLAQMGAVANGTGNLTEANLRAALTQEFGESGYTLTDGDTAWTVKVGEVEESISKSGSTTQNPSGGNNALTLTANVRETESRAAVIEVAVAGEVPTEAELQAKSQEELQPMFVAAMKNDGAPWNTWDEVKQANSLGDDATVNSVFTMFGLANQYTNEYNFIIQKEGYLEPATFTLTGGETITGTIAEFAVTKNGSYTISAVQGGNSGTVSANVDKCKIETFKYPTSSDGTMDAKGNCTITQGDYTVVIPAGFAFGVDGEGENVNKVGDVSKGLVITDSIDTNTGYSTGNEFVWIPVDKDNLTVGKTTKAMATNIGTTENPNYRGVLYNWSSDSTGNTPITYSSNGYREPDAVPYDTGDYSSYGITATTMQNDYNAMIASIKQYGGFYVGRYEMGDGAANISRIGVKPISAAENEANMWYGLYNKAKSYTTKTSVTAGMIWGSQYDAMLNFGLTNSTDSSKVDQNTNGNHSGKLLKTGTWLGESNKTDKINNIFDLEGNLLEWTKEAFYTDYRDARGGCFGTSDALPPSYRPSNYPDDIAGNLGTRLGLYIK